MTSRPLLFSFFKRLKPYWFPATVSFLCDSVITFLGMLVPLFSVIIFDYAYPQRDLFIFTLVTLAAFLLYFIEFFFNAHIDYLNIYISENWAFKLSMECFQRIEALPMKFHGKTKVGDLLVRLTNDIPNIVNHLSQFFPQLITQCIKLVIFFYISFCFDPTIALLAVVGVPFYLIQTRFFSEKLAQVQEEDQENNSQIMDGIQSRLLNIRTIKVFNQQKEEARKLGLHVRKNFFLSLKESLIAISNVFSNSVTIRVWGTFLLWYMGYEVIRGELSLGQVVALGVYIPMLERPIRVLSNLYRETKVNLVSMRRVAKILQEKTEEGEQRIGKPLQISDGSIEFKNVSFRYVSQRPVLENFSVRIPPNTSVAFVGESGSGKSTLLNLLVRFFKPEKGSVQIDEQDISKVDLSSLRENLGVVFQETSILEGTVRENIVYGSKEVEEERVVAAAKEACAHDFILSLPKGYDTYLFGEEGGLSAGQRQRIAIARVFYRDPKILIFDEATSALDAESEFLIQEAINRCLGKKTVLIVAHRLSTIKKVDTIFVLKRGRVVEEGTFNELMEKKGYFFRLYNMQFGGFQKFLELFHIEFSRVLRYKQDLCLVIGCVSEFESLAEKNEPNLLIALMEEVSLFIRNQIRIMDFCSVYLGDKIAICFPETNAREAKAAMTRVQLVLAKKIFEVGGIKTKVTLPVGLVSCKETKLQYGEDVFDYAVQALEELPKGELIQNYMEIKDEE